MFKLALSILVVVEQVLVLNLMMSNAIHRATALMPMPSSFLLPDPEEIEEFLLHFCVVSCPFFWIQLESCQGPLRPLRAAAAAHAAHATHVIRAIAHAAHAAHAALRALMVFTAFSQGFS